MSNLHSINADQRLYVLKSGSGFTCLGFDVAVERAAKYAIWLGRDDLIPNEDLSGTEEGFNQYTAALDAVLKHNVATGKRCPAELTPQLSGLEGKRVEVVDCHGDTRRFYVGRSTGPIPIHLEIKTRRSMGGCGTMGTPYKSVRVVY